MTTSILKVAHGILLRGHPETGNGLDKSALLKALGNIPSTTFRAAAEEIGALSSEPGLRFFDASMRGRIAFGPGAGLAVGVSVGAENVRAVLVDANGWEYHHVESDALAGQTSASPDVVLERIKDTVAKSLEKAFTDSEPDLLVEGELPLLGWAVAWPTPIDRASKPSGNALSHPSWRSGQPLDQRVRIKLGIREMPTYALSDAHAAAIAVAHRETHRPEHREWRHARLTIVLRLAGNVSGGVVILAPTRQDQEVGEISGFVDSILLAGYDNNAGEIGHAPICPSLVAELADNDEAGPLTLQRCSCVSPDDEELPSHLEAYASVLALTKRLYPELPRGEALRRVLDDPEQDRHRRALLDVGALVGDALLSPIAILNPAQITLTGSLALPLVHDEIEERVGKAHKLGAQPAITALGGTENDFIRASGAALALIRKLVHRRLAELLDNEKEGVSRNVRALTIRRASNPL